MEFVGGTRHLSFEAKPPPAPVSLERFWDEVAWQRRQLEEGDTLVPDPEHRRFTVRYRFGGLPAERSERVTATGTETWFLSQHQWGEGTGKVGCGDCGALVRVCRRDPAKLSNGELADRVVDLAEARARLEGEYLAALGELASRSGVQGAAHRLREMNRMTSAAARSDARLALELKENDYSDTLEAMRAGKYGGAVWRDRAMGIVGACLGGRWAYGLLRDSGHTLLDRQAPATLRDGIRRAVERFRDTRVVDLHVWSIGPGVFAAELAVVSHEPDEPSVYKELLSGAGLAHVTVEVHRCPGDHGS